MTQQQKKELLRSQQGELDAVLMYQRLAKIVKTEEERAVFVQLAKEEGRHASVFHRYTKETLKPGRAKSYLIAVLYYVLGRNRLYKVIAKGEYDAAVAYEHLISEFPEVQRVKDDEKRHGDIVSALIQK
ncbi:MAG: rubrerythrin [Bacteroidaceae bacterium]|nr:rubrerythrin [Bacteroidaceae bacterium]